MSFISAVQEEEKDESNMTCFGFLFEFDGRTKRASLNSWYCLSTGSSSRRREAGRGSSHLLGSDLEEALGPPKEEVRLLALGPAEGGSSTWTGTWPSSKKEVQVNCRNVNDTGCFHSSLCAFTYTHFLGYKCIKIGDLFWHTVTLACLLACAIP